MHGTAFTDQMGRVVKLPETPQRIVSLVPSITELLFDLGLGSRVVGVTRFCIHPKIARVQAANVGGTKKLHIERIRDLEPDLIIGSKEENTQTDIDALAGEHNVWMSNVESVDEGIQLIQEIGRITGTSSESSAMARDVAHNFSDLKLTRERRPRVVYLIWNDPIMVVGRENFLNSVLEYCGWQNVFSDVQAPKNSRYPELELKDLIDAEPDCVLLSSEPYPFGEKHTRGFKEVLPNAKVQLVDGELFSWYGSRMLQMPAYLKSLRSALERDLH